MCVHACNPQLAVFQAGNAEVFPIKNHQTSTCIYPNQRIFSFGGGHHQVWEQAQPSCIPKADFPGTTWHYRRSTSHNIEVFLCQVSSKVFMVPTQLKQILYVSWIGHLASTKPGGVNMKFVFETTTSKTISNNGNNISWKNWKHLSWHPMSKRFVQSFFGCCLCLL